MEVEFGQPGVWGPDGVVMHGAGQAESCQIPRKDISGVVAGIRSRRGNVVMDVVQDLSAMVVVVAVSAFVFGVGT